MTVRVILVPRRAHPDRDRLWDWCRRRWETHFPEYDIVEGHHTEGPFNRSAAVNAAALAAGDWDYGIVIDGDIFISRSQVTAAIDRARETGKVTWPHVRWRGLSEDWTRRIVADRRDLGAEIDPREMDLYVERTNPISWSCCIVFPRAVYDDLGGFDERFRGWGYEDMAVQSVIVGLYGHERLEAMSTWTNRQEPTAVYHLWHDRSTPGDGRASKSEGGYTAEAVTNARLGRRYMLALRRDHGLHDRPGLPVSNEERLRDIANLRRDDAALDARARALGLPDWTEWWPTLEELRDGARAYNADQRRGSVTVILHTGGTPDRWPDRRAYLERSIASLSEQVTGPIVQRVIYDCWVDPAIRAELVTIGARHGFYVAGPREPVDFTGSMKSMWTYLSRRARGEFILQVEDDFVYTRPVDLDPMIATLRAQSHLVQIALLRDACYRDEQLTGGILGWPLPAFDFRDGYFEHRQFFTLNPSLFRRDLTKRPWPTGKHSETLFGNAVLKDPAARSAFWGAGEEWIQHIGEVRAGVGY